MTFLEVFYGKELTRDELINYIDRNIIYDNLWDLIESGIDVMKWFNLNILSRDIYENINKNLDIPNEYINCVNLIRRFLNNEDYYQCIRLKNETYFVGIKLDEIFSNEVTNLKLTDRIDDAFLTNKLNCEYNELRFYFKQEYI